MLQTTFKSQILPFGFNPIFLVKGVFGFFFMPVGVGADGSIRGIRSLRSLGSLRSLMTLGG